MQHDGTRIDAGSTAEASKRVFATPLALYRVLRRLWAADTASPSGAWALANPARNHCSVTSLLVQDHFGGALLKTRTSGGTHFYNVIDGTKWDLTVSQFAEPIPYEDLPATRDEALGDCSVAKYELLAGRLTAAMV